MKQVIVRIKDCRATYTRTLAVAYFYSVNQYKSEVLDFVKGLMPHQEIYVKVGNQYSKYISFEELYDLEITRVVDDALTHELINDEDLMYHIKEYLPRY